MFYLLQKCTYLKRYFLLRNINNLKQTLLHRKIFKIKKYDRFLKTENTSTFSDKIIFFHTIKNIFQPIMITHLNKTFPTNFILLIKPINFNLTIMTISSILKNLLFTVKSAKISTFWTHLLLKIRRNLLEFYRVIEKSLRKICFLKICLNLFVMNWYPWDI